MYKYSTCFQPFSWFKVSMGTLVEQGIIAESRMLVNNMIKEGLELCPDDSPLTIEGGRGTPMEVSFAWLYALG